MAYWEQVQNLVPREFICGYCNFFVSSEKGLIYRDTQTIFGHIYVCPNCDKPTYFDLKDKQTPGSAFGNPVSGIPEDNKNINELYEEARICTANNAFTSAVLSCRKLLMHIAVSKGDKEGKKFIEYIEYLSNKGFIPPDGRDWVDQIREKGNEANHEIVIMNKDDAEELISFIEMLLKFIYEFPSKIKKSNV